MSRSSFASRTGVFVIVACAVFASNAAAQVDTRENGFYVGLRAAASGFSVADNGSGFTVEDGGGGVQLLAGYSFNRVFSLQTEIATANHRTSDPTVEVRPGSIALFAHYRFRPGHGLRPYVKGGLGGYTLLFDGDSENVRASGGGVPIGAGLDYFFSRRISLGFDVTYHIISWDKVAVDVGGTTVEVDVDEGGSEITMGLGLGIYF